MATGHGTACCDPHVEALDSLALELREAAADPTLASCCQRDLEEQAAVAKLKARLTAADRTNLRKHVAQGVLGQPPPHRQSTEADEEDYLASSDDEALGGVAWIGPAAATAAAAGGWGWVSIWGKKYRRKGVAAVEAGGNSLFPFTQIRGRPGAWLRGSLLATNEWPAE
jgi:hypothetical protein